MPHPPARWHKGERRVRIACVCAISLGLACGDSDNGGTSMSASADGGSSSDSGSSSSATDTTGTTSPGETGSASTSQGSTDESTGGPPGEVEGIWISVEELLRLPTSGPAWDELVQEAAVDPGVPNLSDQDQDNNVLILARALVCVRTDDAAMCHTVRQAVMDAIETENGGRTLALGRELLAYVIAADLVGLDASDDAAFQTWLEGVLVEDLDGQTLIETHEDRPNNWGTHAGASRVAAAIYLGDDAQVERCADVFKGWLGDRNTYAEFSYGELSWQADPQNPVGINPQGATKDGHSIDGVLPDDQRRGGMFEWPPPQENYVYEALQGALAQAVILYRRGYDVWSWEDQALLRSFEWLHEQASFPAEGDDTFEPHLVNYYYGTDFPAEVPSRAGKNVGYTDWTHAGM